MATFRDLQRQANEMKQRLMEYSDLEHNIVENVVQYAKCLLKPKETDIDENIIKAQMIGQFEITNGFLIAQMITALRKHENKFEIQGNNLNGENVSLEEYCKLICVFLSTKLDIKIDWVFEVYDLNNDGALSKLEMHILLKPCVLHTEDMDPEEATKDIIDIVLTIVDLNKNGQIDLEEFRSLVKKNILYIDLLGQVIPHDKAIKTFLHKIQNKSPLEVAEKFMNERARSLVNPYESKDASFYPVSLELP